MDLETARTAPPAARDLPAGAVMPAGRPPKAAAGPCVTALPAEAPLPPPAAHRDLAAEAVATPSSSGAPVVVMSAGPAVLTGDRDSAVIGQTALPSISTAEEAPPPKRAPPPPPARNRRQLNTSGSDAYILSLEARYRLALRRARKPWKERLPSLPEEWPWTETDHWWNTWEPWREWWWQTWGGRWEWNGELGGS